MMEFLTALTSPKSIKGNSNKNAVLLRAPQRKNSNDQFPLSTTTVTAMECCSSRTSPPAMKGTCSRSNKELGSTPSTASSSLESSSQDRTMTLSSSAAKAKNVLYNCFNKNPQDNLTFSLFDDDDDEEDVPHSSHGARSNDDEAQRSVSLPAQETTTTTTTTTSEVQATELQETDVFPAATEESTDTTTTMDVAALPPPSTSRSTTTPTHSFCSFASPSTRTKRASDFSSLAEHRLQDLTILEECFKNNGNSSISSLEVSLGGDKDDDDSDSDSDSDEEDGHNGAFQRFKTAATTRSSKPAILMLGRLTSSEGGRRRDDCLPTRPASFHEVQESRWKADSSHGGSSAASTSYTSRGGGGSHDTGVGGVGGSSSRRRSSASSSSHANNHHRNGIISGLQRVVDLQNLLPPVNPRTTRRCSMQNSQPPRALSLTSFPESPFNEEDGPQKQHQPQQVLSIRRGSCTKSEDRFQNSRIRCFSTNDLALACQEDEEARDAELIMSRQVQHRRRPQASRRETCRWSASSVGSGGAKSGSPTVVVVDTSPVASLRNSNHANTSNIKQRPR
jgi:hypothetical protein